MAGFKSFTNAAVTICGIELAHRIRKGQFSFGCGRRRHGLVTEDGMGNGTRIEKGREVREGRDSGAMSLDASEPPKVGCQENGTERSYDQAAKRLQRWQLRVLYADLAFKQAEHKEHNASEYRKSLKRGGA